MWISGRLERRAVQMRYHSGRGSSATHLGEENQAVVVLPAKELLSGEGIGKAFRRLDKSFSLDGGVTVYIFEKMRDLTDDECESLRERFHAAPLREH